MKGLELESTTINKGVELRIGKYDLVDDINDVKNEIIAYLDQGTVRDSLLGKLRRISEKVNNL